MENSEENSEENCSAFRKIEEHSIKFAQFFLFDTENVAPIDGNLRASNTQHHIVETEKKASKSGIILRQRFVYFEPILGHV